MKHQAQTDPVVSQWYQDLYGSMVVSRNRWFLVGVLTLILALLEAGALIGLAPFKSVEPYVIQVESKTGITNVLAPLAEKPLTQNEAVTKYFLVKYILARETYDPQDLNHNYDQVRLMSSPDEENRFEDYLQSHDSPVEQFKTTATRTIQVNSVAFLNQKTAQVRFRATRTQLSSNEKQDSYWIATLSYQFVSSPLDEEDRLNNPLGFQIKTYRVDQEVIK